MNLRRIFSYIFKRYILGRRYLLAAVPQYKLHMWVFTRDQIGRHICKYGVHEREVTEFLCREISLKDGDVVVDAGAHIGWYSLIMNQIAFGTSARIIAFEPDPDNFSMLEKNIKLNSANSVTAVQKGLADAAGRMTLHLYHNETNLGRHSLLPINVGRSIEIETVALDSYPINGNPVFIKMDIEGFELVALHGATHFLEKCPLVMLEYFPGYMRIGNLQPKDLFSFMEKYDYVPYLLIDGVLQLADIVELLKNTSEVNLFWRKRSSIPD